MLPVDPPPAGCPDCPHVLAIHDERGCHAASGCEVHPAPVTSSAWFAAWRCRYAVLVDERDHVPERCPEHPDAERIGPAEQVFGIDPALPRRLDHG